MERDYAILSIHLNEIVPAYEFSRLTTLVNDVYDTFIWIEDVKKSKERQHKFNPPSEEERLYIEKADIGTPNLIEFMGVAEHLIEAVKFLSENYNTLLTIGSAALITVEKSNTILGFMGKVKSFFRKPPKKEQMNTVEIIGRKYLAEELMHLKQANKLDEETLEEKNDFMNYVKNISQVSKNIIVNANITIVKSE
ncbi:hypothetical protein [Zobellia sp. 1_MG-2023]|uniref:hypothetical protein n=1 Tax=Zobellia sp. 1_MG-2023 TaxID=3062626 RepID=UPI0026E1759C|nr:hypothetical protein [Zobellia sp. 1_MG-2023]MDO6818874.1 hypothetical protein [Zobellia sp. 1_MG-2023]